MGNSPHVLVKSHKKKERKDLVIEEVVRSEKEQEQGGRWTTWEGVVDRTIKQGRPEALANWAAA